jgi:NTE family protein
MTDDVARFLASSPVFSELPAEQLEQIAPLFRREKYPAGTIVLQQGGVSDAVYFLRSGQMAVRIQRGNWRETVAYLQPPDIFGELSFVTARPCVADVEVLVDAEVLVLHRESVPQLPQQRDGILRALMKVIAGRLQETITRGARVRETPVVLLLNSPNWEAPRSFGWELGRSLARQSGRATLLVTISAESAQPVREIELRFATAEIATQGAGEGLRAELAQSLTEWKGKFENIVLNPAAQQANYVAESTGRFANWMGFLLGPGDPAPTEISSRRFVVQSTEMPRLEYLSGNRQLIPQAARSESEHLAGRETEARFRRTVDSIARYIAGTQVGLALGGGAAWGWAHAGVIGILEEAQFPIDVITGCSMGSVIGALYSDGYRVDEIERISELYRHRTRGFIQKQLLWKLCLLNEKKLRKAFEKYFGTREVNQTQIPFWANAVDIRTGREYTIRDGSLVDCVRSSIALPGLLPPAARDGHLLVDAGIMDPVPVMPVKRMGCHFAIGVNAMAKLDSQEVSSRYPKNAIDVMTRSMFLMAHEIGQARAEQAAAPGIVFTPELGDIKMLQFSRSPEIIECGRRAAAAHLPAIQEAYERLKSNAVEVQITA